MKKLIQSKQKGFTLIEMLIVMVIVGVLILLVFPKASAVLEKTNATGCEAFDKSVEAQKASAELLGEPLSQSELEQIAKDRAKVCKEGE